MFYKVRLGKNNSLCSPLGSRTAEVETLVFLSLCSLDPVKSGCKPTHYSYKWEGESHLEVGVEASHR